MEKDIMTIKKDTSNNWKKAKNFVPKMNEIIIYTDLEPYGTKIGDGKTKVNELPFIDINNYSIEDDTLVINTKLF